ncbi:DUF2089 domain-containing protein [Bacillus sp. 165]|uniref:DUF2089 domain-containing protein n=1 Tax=Bacillus sp. 165 TaxID=1529117 RepID=UPI001ADC3C02|nr:DUF2089 domain-containing protein [Bacillus sp. 165]MBO9130373.1 DUF2089 domain-containing protein [Bacillus sp. 165]
MGYPIITSCPICEEKLYAAQLNCKCCKTVIENEFELPKLMYLEKEQLHFIEVFLKCRGSIKEVERELSISYPTVRNKLEEIIEALGYDTAKKREEPKKKNILDLLDRGEITADEAIEMLKKK